MSLVLGGPSRLGKTQWARSLGDHAYIANMWNLDAFNNKPTSFWTNGYVIFDDINWDSLKGSAKSWFGAQTNFSVSDKYRHKRTIPGGIPAIYLCNKEDFAGDAWEFFRSPWAQLNVMQVWITEPLF